MKKFEWLIGLKAQSPGASAKGIPGVRTFATDKLVRPMQLTEKPKAEEAKRVPEQTEPPREANFAPPPMAASEIVPTSKLSSSREMKDMSVQTDVETVVHSSPTKSTKGQTSVVPDYMKQFYDLYEFKRELSGIHLKKLLERLIEFRDKHDPKADTPTTRMMGRTLRLYLAANGKDVKEFRRQSHGEIIYKCQLKTDIKPPVTAALPSPSPPTSPSPSPVVAPMPSTQPIPITSSHQALAPFFAASEHTRRLMLLDPDVQQMDTAIKANQITDWASVHAFVLRKIQLHSTS